MKSKTWTCVGFKGHWPVGTSAVVVATTEAKARELLSAALQEQGLPGLDSDATLVPVKEGSAVILNDGEY